MKKNRLLSIIFIAVFFICAGVIGISSISYDINSPDFFWAAIGINGGMLIMAVVALEKKIGEKGIDIKPENDPIISEEVEITKYIYMELKKGVPLNIIQSALQRIGHRQEKLTEIINQMISAGLIELLPSQPLTHIDEIKAETKAEAIQKEKDITVQTSIPKKKSKPKKEEEELDE